jgi:MraZ protein
MAFWGTFDYSLDQKNRLTVPAKFRAALADGVVLSKGIEKCIEVWQPKDFESQVHGALAGRNPFSKDARSMRAFFFGNSAEAPIDGAGRIGLPPFLIEHAGLAKEVVVIGAGESLQIWDRDAWTEFNASLGDRIEEITERLDHPA